MNTKILTPFIIIILLLIAGYSSAYAGTHQISKGKTYRSFHVIKNKNVKTLSANKSTDGNLSTNNNRFELGVGNSLILMFVKAYNYKKNGLENTIKANFIDIHLSAGFRFLQYYKIDFRFGYYLFFYVIATIIPFFVSSISLGNVMGTAIAIFLIATYYFIKVHLISVWCFFSAITSILVFFIIQREEQLFKKKFYER